MVVAHTNIVDEVVRKLHTLIDKDRTAIVVRSTVPVGTCDKLKCFFMPEFLTEKKLYEGF